VHALAFVLVVLVRDVGMRTQSKGIDAGFKDEEDDDNVYTKAFQREAAPVSVVLFLLIRMLLLDSSHVVLVLCSQTYRPRAFDDSGAKL
jgi:hypothetical protein